VELRRRSIFCQLYPKTLHYFIDKHIEGPVCQIWTMSQFFTTMRTAKYLKAINPP